MLTLNSARLVFGAAVLVGCAAEGSTPKAPSATSARVAHGEVAAPTVRPSTDTQVKPVAGNDSTPIRLNAGRNAHDSASYLSAIRAGRKAMATWPAGPTPVDAINVYWPTFAPMSRTVMPG